jgi:hypothetical protein
MPPHNPPALFHRRLAVLWFLFTLPLRVIWHSRAITAEIHGAELDSTR